MPDFEKIYVTLRDGLFERWTIFCYKTAISSSSVSYVFSVRPSEIFSLGKYMLEVWLDISARIR